MATGTQTAGGTLVDVVARIAANRGLTIPLQAGQTTRSPNSRPASQVAQAMTDCPVCGGTGWIVPDLRPGATDYGRAVRCRCNAGVADNCGLNEQERGLSADAILGNGPMVQVLRYLVSHAVANPVGWITLWGDYGVAKTLAAQAIVAQLVKAGRSARFYHARQLEQGWFSDVRGDTANAELYRRLPALVIDELDKINVTNDWTRHGLQELLDTRYRAAVAGQSLTVLICQVDPNVAMPGDVASRMADGRFYRPWPGDAGARVPDAFRGILIERNGALWVPGVLRVTGKDARPAMPSRFALPVAGHRAVSAGVR